MVTGGETVYQVYDGVDLIAEYLEGGQLRRRIVHGPGVDEPIAEDSFAGATPTRQYLHADHQGSVVASSDAGGTAAQQLGYGLFGESEQEAGPTLRYTGQRYEPETGLYYYKARFYSPYLGRFLQADPIGYEDGLNLYAYVGNDPINFTDPSGQVGAAGAVIGGLIEIGVQIYTGEANNYVRAFDQLLDGNVSGAVRTAGASAAKVGISALAGASGAGLVNVASRATTSIAQTAVLGATFGAQIGVIGEVGKAAVDGRRPTLQQVGVASGVGAVTGGLGATVPGPAGRVVAGAVGGGRALGRVAEGVIDTAIGVAGEAVQQRLGGPSSGNIGSYGNGSGPQRTSAGKGK